MFRSVNAQRKNTLIPQARVMLTCPSLSLSSRLPDGQADGGPGAVGKLRNLEEQLIRAKEKINSYRSLPADGV